MARRRVVNDDAASEIGKQMTDDIKPLGIQHAKITGQVMRDHWGPIVERIADEIADPRDAFINELISENERLRQPKTVTFTVVSAADGNPMHTFKIDPTKKTILRPLHSMIGYVFEPEDV